METPRFTIRLPIHLKKEIERIAGKGGISKFIISAVKKVLKKK
jgi:hypothetical protein